MTKSELSVAEKTPSPAKKKLGKLSRLQRAGIFLSFVVR
jgi:hypothetical protein